MTGRKRWALALAVLFAHASSGEELKKPIKVAAVTNPMTTSASGTASTAAPGTPKNFFGVAEIRPSWAPNGHTLTSEDYAELGYNVSPDIKLSYAQNFVRTLYSPSTKSSDVLGSVDAGLLRARINNFWVNTQEGLSLSYEQRLYLPTAQRDRDQGMIAVSRNYIKFAKAISPDVSVILMDLPILAAYDRPGFLRGTTPVANPIFQNRIYLLTSINFTKSLNLVLPIMFHQTRYRDFMPTARANDGWDFMVWTYPELTLTVNGNLTFGLAYYSDSFVKPDLSGFTIGQGFENGIVQLVATAYL